MADPLASDDARRGCRDGQPVRRHGDIVPRARNRRPAQRTTFWRARWTLRAVRTRTR